MDRWKDLEKLRQKKERDEAQKAAKPAAAAAAAAPAKPEPVAAPAKPEETTDAQSVPAPETADAIEVVAASETSTTPAEASDASTTPVAATENGAVEEKPEDDIEVDIAYAPMKQRSVIYCCFFLFSFPFCSIVFFLRR